jgi:hypothetical protein
MARSFIFLGTARTSVRAEIRREVNLCPSRRFKFGDVLFSGICTKKSFLHSLGLVMCAGMKGYYVMKNIVSSDHVARSAVKQM